MPTPADGLRTAAEIRLAQYGERTSSWSTATYNDGTEKALHDVALGLKAEIDRLRAELDRAQAFAADATDQTALRDRIAEALADALKPRYGGPQHNTPGGLPLTATEEEVRLHRAQPLADAVLSVLPASADRADVLRALADQQTQLAVADDLSRRRDMAAARRELVRELRRVAAQAPWATDGARIGRVLIWSHTQIGNDEFGRGYRAAQEQARDILTRPLAGTADQPAVGRQSSRADGDRVVAYRSALPGAMSIYCTGHTGELGDGVLPLTSDDLPDGGLCASCGVDVLIPQQPKETEAL